MKKLVKTNSELIQKRWKEFADKYGFAANIDSWDYRHFVLCLDLYGIDYPDEDIYEAATGPLPF